MRKNWIIGIAGFSIIMVILGTLIYLNGYHIRIINEPFGRSFNNVRDKIGQPLIEQYFVSKKVKTPGVWVWDTPDSLKEKVLHQRKQYWVDHLMRIKEEVDYYNISFSPDWIKMIAFDTVRYEIINAYSDIDTIKIDNYPKQIFTREYHFANDSVIYEIKIFINGNKLIKKTLSKVKGDSIINAQLNRHF
jgi:hypothetical protein